MTAPAGPTAVAQSVQARPDLDQGGAGIRPPMATNRTRTSASPAANPARRTLAHLRPGPRDRSTGPGVTA